MIQSIINGIINALRTEYVEKTYRIYTESTEQGLIEPCFSVLCLDAQGEREISDRFKRYFPFMITYFPSSAEPIAECNEVCEMLLGLLNEIETDMGVVHATDMPKGQVIDGKLQFSIQYDVFAMLQRNKVEDMGNVTVETTTV